MTDKDKIMRLADALGDEVKERGTKLVVPGWKRRFTFNDDGEIIMVEHKERHPISGRTSYAVDGRATS